MVLLGLAFFVVGAAIVFIVVHNSGGSSSSASADTVPVLVAKVDLAAGTQGEDVVSKVEVQNVSVPRRAADALTAPGQLSNQLLTRSFTKGEQITQSGLRARSLLTQSVKIPDGFEAVAVTTEFTAGGAGYIAPNDLVNVYAAFGEISPAATGAAAAAPLPYSTPHVELLLTNVRVLDVQTQVAPLNAQAATTGGQVAARPIANGTLTVLLAVKAIDAEKVIFVTNPNTSNVVYLSRVNDKNAPVDVTPGRDYYNIFDEEPGAAYQRSGPA
jgi:Flp pilus assembly protein CpaB